jgi:N-acetylmuramoyl-L-alanine amidase
MLVFMPTSLLAGALADGKEGEMETYLIEGESYVKSCALAQFLDGSESIDFINKKGRTECDGFSIEYSLFSTYVKSGDDVYNIYKPVVFRDGAFMLPLRYVTSVLNKVSNLEFVYSGRILKVRKSEYNVTGINAAQKMNGLLIEIFTDDRLRYDALKTDDNWLVVTITGGKVDSAAFAGRVPVKSIYEVKTYQFDNSCQVSIRLRPNDFTFTSKLKQDPYRIQFLVRGDGFSDRSAIIEDKLTESFSDNPIDVIVVDAGHGGEDHGATGPSSLKEKDVALKIAKHLNKLLKEDGRFKPIMTRQDDVFVPLSGRTELANSVGGDLFISIHANAAPNKKASGIIAFFLAEPKTDQARATASLENSSIRFENLDDQKLYNSDLDFTLRDMMQSEFLRESADLADIIQSTMSGLTGLGSRGVDQAGFFVLDKAYMPAILLETGFITNKSDEKRLKDDDFQKKTAKAIYDSIVAFKERYEGQQRPETRANDRSSQ